MSRNNPYDPIIFPGGIYPSELEAENTTHAELPPEYSYLYTQPSASNTFFRSHNSQRDENVILFCGKWCPEIPIEEFRKVMLWALNTNHDPIIEIISDHGSKKSFFFTVSKEIGDLILQLNRHIGLRKISSSTLERTSTFVPTFLDIDPTAPSYRYPKHTLFFEVARHYKHNGEQQQEYVQQKPRF